MKSLTWIGDHTRRIVFVGIAVLVWVIVVYATSGSGFLFNIILSRASTPQPLRVFGNHQGWVVSLFTNKPADFVVQDVALVPGGYIGWHSHPGPVLITVKSGTATWYHVSNGKCVKTVYPTGSAFVEPPDVVHTVQNEDTVNVELINTYIVPVGAVTRTEENDPGVCPGVP